MHVWANENKVDVLLEQHFACFDLFLQEGKDKLFLISKLQAISGDRKRLQLQHSQW